MGPGTSADIAHQIQDSLIRLTSGSSPGQLDIVKPGVRHLIERHGIEKVV